MNKARKQHNAYAGYHSFRDVDDAAYGSFEVFYADHDLVQDWNANIDKWSEGYRAGWYWHACLPGCLPDGDPMGPFTSSRAAYRDALETS